MKKIVFLFLMLACAGAQAQTGDLVDTATQQGSLTKWSELVKTVELDRTLHGKGPFTIFAPSDQAFARIQPSTMALLTKPENRVALMNLLSYHIVPGKIMTGDFKSMAYPTRINADLQITKNGTTLMVNSSHITQPDIETSNGVIHIIDDTLFPPGVKVETTTEQSVNGKPTQNQQQIIDIHPAITAPKTGVTR